MRPRSIVAVLQTSPELEAVMPLVDRLVALRRALHGVIPAELADCASVVALRQDAVAILADNSAVAAKLRLLEPALVRACRRVAPQVTYVRVRVRPAATAARAVRTKRARLDAGPAAALARLADALPPSPLREAVARLSRRGPG